MPEVERNAFDRLRGLFASWKATFDNLQASIGKPGAAGVVILVVGGLVWWSWNDLSKKPGVDWIVASVARWIEGFRPPQRFSGFTVRFQDFAKTPGEPDSNSRFWTWAGGHWEEKTPGGEVMYHDHLGKISLDGCSGDRTKKQGDENLKFFIPYKDCSNLMLRFNFSKGGWKNFGAIVSAR